MRQRDHLRRLPRKHYQGDAIVHWTITTLDRKTGWLSGLFFYRFRELLAHTTFRYSLVCPIFCLMPDHCHMVWMGLASGSDQLNAMKHFRPRCEESLQRIGIHLQDQAYDHVLKDDERKSNGFHNFCEYIARNPERAGLVDQDNYQRYAYTGCVIPGYPELRIFEPCFWDRFDRIVSNLRTYGVLRTSPEA